MQHGDHGTVFEKYLPLLLAIVALILARGEIIYRGYYSAVKDTVVYRDPSSGIVDKMTQLTKPYLSFEGNRDTRWQTQSYWRMIEALMIGCVAIWLLDQAVPLDSTWVKKAAIFTICLLLIAYLPAVSLLASYSVEARLMGLIIAIAAVRYRAALRSKSIQCAAVIASFVFLIDWIGCGLFVPINLTAWDEFQLEELQAEWALNFGPADAILTGSLDHLLPNQGNWSALFAVAIGRFWRPLNLGGYLKLTGVLQLLFFTAYLVSWIRYSNGRWFAATTALLFSASCFYFGGNCSLGYFNPNQNAWQYLFFSINTCVQVMMLKAGCERTAWMLGFLSGISVTHNLETGIAITTGNMICLALRAFQFYPYPNPTSAKKSLMMAGIGAASAFLCFGVVSCLIVGSAPAWYDAFESVRAFWFASRSQLHGGNIRQFDVLALVIFGHAALVVLVTVSRIRSLSHRDCFRAGVAVTILAWFSHFAFHPHIDDLTIFFSLYGVLLIDAWQTMETSIWLRQSLRRPPLAFVVSFAVIGFVVIPNICQHYLFIDDQSELTRQLRSQRSEGGVLVDGVILRETAHLANMQRRAEFIRSQTDRHHSRFLTMDSFLMPRLAGYWPQIGTTDIFVGTAAAYRFEVLKSQLTNPSIELIYLDQDSLDENSLVTYGVNRHSWQLASRWLFHYLRTELEKDYVLAGCQDGWEIWKRK